jgi:hypothetical protein
MNYITNYYKNLSEQLQEQVNQLENLILEYKKTKTQRVDIVDVERGYRGEAPLLHGRIVTKKGNPAGKGAAKERDVAFYPGMGSMPNYRGNDEADAEETIYDWGRPTVENNPIYANLVGKGPAQDVLRAEIFDTQINRKGGSVKGTGKKAQKKAKAIRSAEYDRRQQRGVDSRTSAIRQQPPLKRNSPDANPGRVM